MSYFRTGSDAIVNPFVGLNLDAISAGSQSNNQIVNAFGAGGGGRPPATPPGPPALSTSGGSIPWLWIGGGVAVLLVFGLLRKKK
jgi:hypothetical protein